MTPVRRDPANRLDLFMGARSVGLDDVPYAEVSSHFCTSLPQRIRAPPVIVFCVYLRLSRERPQELHLETSGRSLQIGIHTRSDSLEKHLLGISVGTAP